MNPSLIFQEKPGTAPPPPQRKTRILDVALAMPDQNHLALDFDAATPRAELEAESIAPSSPELPAGFGEEPELPPTWTEDSLIFHTTEKCTRLQAIRKNRRISGRPGVAMRPCFNCEDILRAKRTG